jgi:hypothetical protein
MPDVDANAANIVDDAERYDNERHYDAANAANAMDIVDDAAKNAAYAKCAKRVKYAKRVKRVKRDAVYPSCYIVSFPISSSGRRMNQSNYTIF